MTAGSRRSERFLQTRHIQFIALQSLEPAISKVDRHQLDMLLDLQDAQYWINSNSANGYVLERLLGDSPLQRQAVSGEEIRYVDWVVPGVPGHECDVQLIVRGRLRDRALPQERGAEAAPRHSPNRLRVPHCPSRPRAC